MGTDRFRQVLGHFCTGVTVVTAVDADGPVGFACQAFAALSLDPPLVLFCPGGKSSSWQRIERTGRFCVNVLAVGAGEHLAGVRDGRGGQVRRHRVDGVARRLTRHRRLR